MTEREGSKFDPFPFFRRAMVAISHAADSGKARFFICLTLVILMLNFTAKTLPQEYVSEATFLGIPLVCCGSMAFGWFAYGGVAVGFVAFGGCAVGPISVGGLALGAISLGGGAFGLVAALGGGAAGYYSFGGGSMGAFAYGGMAKGYYIADGRESESLIGAQEGITS